MLPLVVAVVEVFVAAISSDTRSSRLAILAAHERSKKKKASTGSSKLSNSIELSKTDAKINRMLVLPWHIVDYAASLRRSFHK